MSRWNSEPVRLASVVLLICLMAADLGDRITGAMSEVAHSVMAQQLQGSPGAAANGEAPQTHSGDPRRFLVPAAAPGEEPVMGAPAIQPEKTAENQDARRPEEQAAPVLGPQHPHESLLGRYARAGFHWLDLHGNALIALFTVVLTIATTLQWNETRRSVGLSRIAAEAAGRSADAAAAQTAMLLTQEKPLIVIRLVGQSWEGHWEYGSPPNRIRFQAKNYGRSLAIARVHGIDSAVGEEAIGFSSQRFEGDADIVVEPTGGVIDIRMEVPTTTRLELIQLLNSGEAKFSFEWRLITEDLFQNWTIHWVLYRYNADREMYELLASTTRPLPSDPENGDPGLKRLMAMIRPMRPQAAGASK